MMNSPAFQNQRLRVLGGTRVAALCLLAVAGVQSLPLHAQAQEPPATEKAKDPDPAATPQPAAGLPALVDPKTYRIGTEDVLQIEVWKEPELSGPVQVRPDGAITVRLIGELNAAGLSPEELAAKLKAEYGRLVNNPVVQVTVQQVRSKKYYIIGNVNRTGEFPLVVPTTILEALSKAGGLGEWANKKNIVIMRGTDRKKFNYKDVIKGKNMEQNILLENGDFIIVE